MLTPEEIKKLIEIAKPDGFEYRGERGIYFFAHTYKVTSGTFKRVVYPLFLQRCRQGVNREFDKGEYTINLEDGYVEVMKGRDVGYRQVESDQRLEEALRYILEQMEG